jgi:hypothetical protein
LLLLLLLLLLHVSVCIFFFPAAKASVGKTLSQTIKGAAADGEGGREERHSRCCFSNEIQRSLHYTCRNEFIWRSARLCYKKKKKKKVERMRNDWRNALIAVKSFARR